MKKYAHYEKWEDYQNGMFETIVSNKSELIDRAKMLLNNPIAFYKVSLKVIKEWKVASMVNLSNVDSNRFSWIGQAACCYACKVPEILTRKAWGELHENDRHNANLIANKVIKIYEERHKAIYQQMEEARVQKRHTRRSAAEVGAIKQSTFI